MLYLHALFYSSMYCLLCMPVGYKQCCLEPLCHLFGVFFFNLLLKHVTINLIVNLIGLQTTHQRCTSLHVSVRTFPDTDWVRFAPNVSGTQAKQEKGERQLVWVSPLPCSLCVCRCEPAPTATALSVLLPPHHMA